MATTDDEAIALCALLGGARGHIRVLKLKEFSVWMDTRPGPARVSTEQPNGSAAISSRALVCEILQIERGTTMRVF